jgi:hypothetical protein
MSNTKFLIRSLIAPLSIVMILGSVACGDSDTGPEPNPGSSQPGTDPPPPPGEDSEITCEQFWERYAHLCDIDLTHVSILECPDPEVARVCSRANSCEEIEECRQGSRPRPICPEGPIFPTNPGFRGNPEDPIPCDPPPRPICPDDSNYPGPPEVPIDPIDPADPNPRPCTTSHDCAQFELCLDGTCTPDEIYF